MFRGFGLVNSTLNKYKNLLKSVRNRLVSRWRTYTDNPHRQLFGEFYYRISTKEKVVALTFDDGPLEPYTSNLLNVLDAHEVKATFFFVGVNIEQYEEVARQCHLRGHQIGNHSYSHHRLTGKSFGFIRTQIAKTDALIRGLGVDYKIDFRAPYGNKFFKLPYVLWRMRKKHILFDFFPNPRDWWGRPASEVVKSILELVRPGSIIVLHDGNKDAAPLVCEYVDMLIVGMKKDGYRFVTVNTLLELAN